MVVVFIVLHIKNMIQADLSGQGRFSALNQALLDNFLHGSYLHNFLIKNLPTLRSRGRVRPA